MTELRLHRTLYAGAAVDRAVEVYAKVAVFERRDDSAYWVVEVTASSPSREQRIVRELANYALGLTVSGTAL